MESVYVKIRDEGKSEETFGGFFSAENVLRLQSANDVSLRGTINDANFTELVLVYEQCDKKVRTDCAEEEELVKW